MMENRLLSYFTFLCIFCCSFMSLSAVENEVDIISFGDFVTCADDLDHAVIKGVDFSNKNVDWQKLDLHKTWFIDCKFSSKQCEKAIEKQGGEIFPDIDDVPYDPFRNELYTVRELTKVKNKDGVIFDVVVDHYFVSNKFNPSIKDAMAQYIHDSAITKALNRYLMGDDDEMDVKCVGIMGGHSALRGDHYYIKVAHIARLLTKAGYLVVTGGGPGIMEAGHLGAYMAKYDAAALDDAIDILSKASHYEDKDYNKMAKIVLEKYPDGSESLAVPTWFYSNESTNMFVGSVAKYFSNAIREEMLLKIAMFGVIYAPGGGGTNQEIFTDLAQNQYCHFGVYSPMVFLGEKHYMKDSFIYPLVRQLAWGYPFFKLINLFEEPEQVVEFIKNNPPIITKEG